MPNQYSQTDVKEVVFEWYFWAETPNLHDPSYTVTIILYDAIQSYAYCCDSF